MKTSQALLATFGLLTLASAAERRWDNGTVWTTEIVTAYTTYCPSPTTIVQNNQTYTVMEATTLTITNCPCTISSTASVVTPVTTVPTSPSATPVTTAGSGTATTTGPVLVSNAAGVLGSPFGALVIGGAIAVLL